MYEINLTPPEPTVNGRLLAPLVDLYLQERAKKLDPQTIVNYYFLLDRFVAWWASVGPAADWVLSPSRLTAYNDWLTTYTTKYGDTLSVQGQRDSLRRLRQVFAWAYRKHYIPADISGWIEIPSAPARPPQAFPANTVQRLLTACDHSHDPVRDRAIIAFLAGTGARLRETAYLEIKDVQIDADHSGIALMRTTKLDKPRYVAFGRVTGDYLIAWLDQHGRLSGTLFAVGPKGIYEAVRNASQRAGLREIVKGPHDLRRLFITHWTATRPGPGYNLLLSRQVGHSSYAVTETYAKNTIEDIRKHYVSPLDSLTGQTKRVGVS